MSGRPAAPLGPVLVLGLGIGLLACARGGSMESIQNKVRRDFPQVAQMSTDELARRLAAGERPVLLDVRRQDEYAVSHLAGAVRVDPDDSDPELPAGTTADTPIVAYCSVGYRSSRLAQALAARGHRRVWNLEGSIFAWAAEGRPLYRDGRRVTQVHPYGRAWAWLVPADLRAYEPSSAR